MFFFVVRGILRFDRTERKVHAQIEAEERAARVFRRAPESDPSAYCEASAPTLVRNCCDGHCGGKGAR